MSDPIVDDQVEEFLYSLLISHCVTGKKNYTVESCAKQIRQQVGRELLEHQYSTESRIGPFVKVTKIREVCKLEETNHG